MSNAAYNAIMANDLIKFAVVKTVQTTSSKNEGTAATIPSEAVLFPRVRADFRMEYKPIYTNASTNQEGVETMTFIRNQLVISNVNFDPCDVSLFRQLCDAMHLGKYSDPISQAHTFTLYYRDFLSPSPMTNWSFGEFIVKSFPITVECIKPNSQIIRIDSVTFQQV